MEAKLLEQALALAPRARACGGNGIFSGISTLIDGLVLRLPAAVPADAAACEAATAAAQPVLQALQVRGARVLGCTPRRVHAHVRLHGRETCETCVSHIMHGVASIYLLRTY